MCNIFFIYSETGKPIFLLSLHKVPTMKRWSIKVCDFDVRYSSWERVKWAIEHGLVPPSITVKIRPATAFLLRRPALRLPFNDLPPLSSHFYRFAFDIVSLSIHAPSISLSILAFPIFNFFFWTQANVRLDFIVCSPLVAHNAHFIRTKNEKFRHFLHINKSLSCPSVQSLIGQIIIIGHNLTNYNFENCEKLKQSGLAKRYASSIDCHHISCLWFYLFSFKMCLCTIWNHRTTIMMSDEFN